MRHGTLNTGNPKRGVTRAGAEAMLRATDALATQENWLQSGEQAMRQIARDLGFGVLQDDGDRSNVYERQNASFYRRSAWADVEPLYVRLPGDKTRWAVGAKAVALPSRQPVLWLGWHAEAWQYRTAARLARARAQAQAVLDWLERDGWERLTILAGDLNTDVDGKSLAPLYAAGFTNAHRRLGRTPTFGKRVVLDHILWRDPERVLTPRRLSTVRTGSDHRGLVLTYDLKPAKRATTPPPKPPPVVTPPTPEPETPKPPEEEPVSYYLETNPPRQRQFRDRRAKPTGAIVIHTAESVMDSSGEDTGAEGVARFIRDRTSYGSYHRLVDSDSIVPLVRFSKAAYGDGTGSNEWAVHISFAIRTTDWRRMNAQRKEAFLRNGARAAAEAARWLKAEYGITVPAKHISRADSEAGRPGFLSHAQRDPDRRSDPGADFDWSRFLALYAEEMKTTGSTDTESKEDDMAWLDEPINLHDPKGRVETRQVTPREILQAVGVAAATGGLGEEAQELLTAAQKTKPGK